MKTSHIAAVETNLLLSILEVVVVVVVLTLINEDSCKFKKIYIYLIIFNILKLANQTGIDYIDATTVIAFSLSSTCIKNSASRQH